MKYINSVIGGLLLLMFVNVSASVILRSDGYAPLIPADDYMFSSPLTDTSFDLGFSSYLGNTGFFFDPNWSSVIVSPNLSWDYSLWVSDPIIPDFNFYDFWVITFDPVPSYGYLDFTLFAGSSFSSSSGSITIAYPGYLTGGIPEPATLALLGLGLAGLRVVRHKK